MAALASALTPAPIAALPAATRSATLGHGWHRLAAAPDGAALLARMDPWAARNMTGCVTLEDNWPAAVTGSCLAHGDIRADNVLLTDDRVIFVDWPWARLAPPWFDLIGMLPSVAMQGGPRPEAVLAQHPVARDADPQAMTVMIAALAGFFCWQGSQPDPPGLPTVRAFQRAQGAVALDWLRQRTGWS